MGGAAIRLWPALAGPVVRPGIYGHFAEHLGRCVHGGIWVGERSRVPNESGVRLDVLAALKHLRAPVVRWPGGCFADDYHWRDGVGPRAERPATVNAWWRQGESNEFGTDEFARFCAAAGADAYFCANVGSGSPREARDWVEYCNFGGDSALTRLRAANGSAAPHGVRWWGVGNENWGCGGRFDGAGYAGEYRRFANYMRQIDPSIQLVACGASFGDRKNPVLNEWNHDFCAALKHPDLLDHLSLHRYFSRGAGADFSDGEFRALFADVHAMERDLELTGAVLRYYFPDRFVGIVVDEWGVWHPSATVENGLEQENTLRDALLAGSVLNLFNRWARRVTMANIAQTVNVLQCMAVTRGNAMFLTPTYYVFELMRPHMNGRLVTQEVEGPSYEAHGTGFTALRTVDCLDASASLSGRKLHLTVVNRSLGEDLETPITLNGAKAASVSAKILSAPVPNAMNSFETPSAVTAKRTKSELREDGSLVHVFPRHSMTALTITLQ